MVKPNKRIKEDERREIKRTLEENGEGERENGQRREGKGREEPGGSAVYKIPQLVNKGLKKKIGKINIHYFFKTKLRLLQHSN